MGGARRSRQFDRPGLVRAVIGGGVGGLAGAILFGLLLRMTAPEILAESIPQFYGLMPAATLGWTLHLLHGLVLGAVFGVVASRPRVFDAVTGPVETDALVGISAETRFGLLGLVYGIAIWAIVPFIGLSLLGAVADVGSREFTHLAAEMVLGHAIFGVIVGLVFALFIDDGA